MAIRTPDRALSYKDVERLGSIGAYEYVEHRGAEYRMSTRPMAAGFTADPPKDGEIRLAEEQTTVDSDGYETRSIATRQGYKVPSGTFAGLQREATARKQKVARRHVPRFVDVIAGLSIAQAKGGHALTLGPADAADPIFRAELGLQRPYPPAARMTPRTEAATTVREVMERIAHRGVVMVVIDGHLVASPPGGKWPAGVAEAIGALEPLITGLLSGAPLHCGFKHAAPVEATTLLFPRLPSCGAH